MATSELEQELRSLHPEAYSWSLVCCRGDRATAEDVLQESYLRVLDGRLSFDGRSSLKTWFFSVVRRAARDRVRRRNVRRALLGQWGSKDASEPPAAQALVERKERRQAVRTMLGKLTERQRQVLELVFFHDRSVREAATVLGVSPGTASRHYDRGKRLLLAELEEAGFEQ